MRDISPTNSISVDTIWRIGWIASILSMLMYFSYIDQIRLNLSGHPGSIILPIVTTISCTTWIIYAGLKSPKDWPIIACNIPGVILGIITVVTAVLA